jgi:hypothetical protein
VVKWGAAAALILVYGYAQANWITPSDPRLVTLDRSDRGMLQFIESMPVDSLIAGHPLDMDNVPLFARRKVLVNRELSQPYYYRFYQGIKGRVKDMLGAYYAEDWRAVAGFAAGYGVDAMVVSKDRYPDPGESVGRLYYEPFDSALREKIGERRDFALLNPPPERKCYENDKYIVVCFGN